MSHWVKPFERVVPPDREHVREAIPALAEALDDESPELRARAAEALAYAARVMPRGAHTFSVLPESPDGVLLRGRFRRSLAC